MDREGEDAVYMGFFDPVEGPVPNPGMGVSAYVHSDHMYRGYPGQDLDERKKKPPLPVDRASFDRLIQLPYVDNLYLRYEWKDMQKKRGKLEIPEAWKWTLEASEKQGKRWSFRIMNSMKGSMSENSLPDFLQGKLKMIPYWNDGGSRGPNPKYFPAFSDEYLDYWGEFVNLLGEAFDDHPLLEYADVSGYGFWGEFHHYAQYAPGASTTNYQPGTPERVEHIIERLIRDHLAAFPNTPAVLNIHAGDYESGEQAFREGQVWARRDSFRYNFSTSEVRMAQGLTPGTGMVWEILRPGLYCPVDEDMPTKEFYQLPQRYFDIAAHYVAMGFNLWDAIWAHEHCIKTYQIIEQQIGYRIRPSIIWRRKLHGNDEIVLGLRNDGCAGPPGQLTIKAGFPDGREITTRLPMGEPAPGAMKLYGLPLFADANMYLQDTPIELILTLQMRGKIMPVRWAVPEWQAKDPFVLKVPFRKL